MHILGHLGGIDMVDELNGDKVHWLENVMTITLGAHNLIDTLYMWFEPMVCSCLVQLAKVVHFAHDIQTFRTHTTYLQLSQDWSVAIQSWSPSKAQMVFQCQTADIWPSMPHVPKFLSTLVLVNILTLLNIRCVLIEWWWQVESFDCDWMADALSYFETVLFSVVILCTLFM